MRVETSVVVLAAISVDFVVSVVLAAPVLLVDSLVAPNVLLELDLFWSFAATLLLVSVEVVDEVEGDVLLVLLLLEGEELLVVPEAARVASLVVLVLADGVDCDDCVELLAAFGVEALA
jgi:hypothetical protein